MPHQKTLLVIMVLTTAAVLGPRPCAAEALQSPTGSDPSPALVADLRGSEMSHWEVLMFVSLQGMANRQRPRIYLKLQRSDNTWLKWYRKRYGMTFDQVEDPYALFDRARWPIRGYVMVDPKVAHTANIAANYASISNLLPVTPRILREHAARLPDLPVVRDLRKKFRKMSVYQIYRWAYAHQWPDANHRYVANYSVPQPGANAFIYQHHARDMVIAHGGFFFELTSTQEHEKERRLKGRILEDMPPLGYVFGWHTPRGTEGAHVAQVSKYNQIVLCSTTASNFSFHQHIDAEAPFRQPQKKTPPEVTLDPGKIYVCYIYSDGDSLNHFSRLHGYQWLNEKRGTIPVGWEIQPLLAEMAPGMLAYFYQTATPNDTFVASASGIGYTYPGKMSKRELKRLLIATRPYLKRTHTTSLVVLHAWYMTVSREIKRIYDRLLGDLLHGVVEGYWATSGKSRLFPSLGWLPSALPELDQKRQPVDNIVQSLKELAASTSERPLFVPIHVIKGPMSFNDLVEITRRLDPRTFKVVGPDELLIAFAKARSQHRKPAPQSSGEPW